MGILSSTLILRHLSCKEGAILESSIWEVATEPRHLNYFSPSIGFAHKMTEDQSYGCATSFYLTLADMMDIKTWNWDKAFG